MKITCEVSVGDAIDRLSILKIKLDKIKDENRLKYIRKEVDSLERSLAALGDYSEFLALLKKINETLWDCNEDRKALLRIGDFGETYIRLTVLESEGNDERFKIKSLADNWFGSELREQKSYEWLYRNNDNQPNDGGTAEVQ
jgi:hypothetical protein